MNGDDVNAVLMYVIKHYVASPVHAHKGIFFMFGFNALLAGGLRPVSLESLELSSMNNEDIGDNVRCTHPPFQ